MNHKYLAWIIHTWQQSRREPSGAKAQPEADPSFGGNGFVPWRGLQAVFVKRTPGKNSRAVPGAQHGNETFRLGAFAPPGSLFD